MRLFKGITKRAPALKSEVLSPFRLEYAALKKRNRVWVHGHRGSASSHPENTLASFQEGYRAGADLIELDVHLSSDGVPVVFHDEMISPRVCREESGKRPARKIAVRRLTLEQLGLYHVGSVSPRKSRKFTDWRPVAGERIPTLDAVCSWAAAQDPAVGLNIEIKMGGEPLKLRPDPDEFAEKVVAVVKQRGLSGRVQLQSFFPDMVKALVRAAPQENVSFLIDRRPRWLPFAKRLGVKMVGPRFKLLTKEIVAACHEEGIAVVPWTVNLEVHWARLVHWGIDGLITDYPRKLVQFLSKYN